MQSVVQQKEQPTSLVLGLGATGLSCLEYLSPRSNVLACDDKLTQARQEELQKQFRQVEFLSVSDAQTREDYDAVIASPGISDHHPLIANALVHQIPVVCDIEIFAHVETKPVIAITGTNGKSTVVSWLAHVLNAAGRSCALAGNIGTPALDILEQEHDCCVLELSSFQLERTFSLTPLVALILNISSDHLDRYENIQAYQAAKEKIYQNAEIAIVNRDAKEFELPSGISKTISFGISESSEEFGVIDLDGHRYLTFAHKQLVATDKLPLIGEHNVSNALAVLACAYAIGIEPKNAINALLTFSGLPHRTEMVRELDGVRYINDSKATNAGATIAAVDGDLQQIVLIAGGDAKKADLEPLHKALKDKLKVAILLGKDAQELAEVLRPLCQCVIVASIEDAVTQAHAMSVRGDTVLLSPACSSQDMFKNYIERGERFKTAVLDLQSKQEVLS